MRFPDALSPETFLADFWQKNSLFMPRALDRMQTQISAGELAWLATQDDVESRLVFTKPDGDRTRYEVRHGPFANDVLSSLPRQNWALLVQDIEKHLPDFRSLFAAIDFIPDWRIDDLMVSFAAPGGSVGPHRDNYDVFLCQGEGIREWHLGDNNNVIEDASSNELSLLKPFIDNNPKTANEGDILYLPPGLPHWGIATDFCMTYSIGMRAPNLAELHAAAARLFEDLDDVSAKSSVAGVDVFYEDPDLTTDEAIPGLISGSAIHRARKILHQIASLDQMQIAMIIGSVATDPKAWLAPERVTGDEAESKIRELPFDAELAVHGMARIAYWENEASGILFANGFARPASADELAAFCKLCKFRTARRNSLCADEGDSLLHWLLTTGVIDLTENDG